MRIAGPDRGAQIFVGVHECVSLPVSPLKQIVDEITGRAAAIGAEPVTELLAIVRSLFNENPALREAVSPRFARHRPPSLEGQM
jgi:hypothetical protein